MTKEPELINMKCSDEDLKGRYASVLQIYHTKEEFVCDFLNVLPPTGTLSSRVIVTPSNLKEMIKAMQDNLKKYEKSFGKINPKQIPRKSLLT